MLPEKLSNILCSLRPHEDKLTFSAVFTFDQNLKLSGKWFGKTIIHSDRRFTYEEAQEILESGTGDFAKELRQLNKIAAVLRKERFKKGAINFETPEVQFRLAPDGTPIEAFVKERKEAHLLIEDFMLLANKEVATFIHEKGKEKEIPFVYRIHDEPNLEKLEDFALFAREFGFQMDISSPSAIAKSLNRLVEEASKEPALKLLEQPAIRTMAKAAYSTDNIGHYGLAFPFYTHFTSPIRRYSDVLAHRLLERNLGSEEFFRVKKDKLEAQCKHISMQERKAMEAERESVKYKQAEFMEKHLGQEFDGIISGISERGLFVTLPDTLCEGMIAFDSMEEPFRSTGSKLSVKGAFTGRQIKTGDLVRVRITHTDLSRRTIDMILA
jgi:ribonuclease R